MQYPLFYNSVNQDRVYDADSFSDWLKKFFTTGVFKDEMQVTAAGGMYVQVGSGYVNIGGKVMQFDQSTLTVGTADSRYYRIDSVIVERNDTDRDFTLKIVPGGTGTESSVTGVTPTRSGGIYQLVLARIKVKPGATYIVQADITDTRADADLCGIVAGTVTQMDFEQFSTQFADYFDRFKANNKADFDAWFADIQDILDGDVAGNLLNKINERVRMDTPYLELDTTAESGTDDAVLYDAIVSIGWQDDVIEE